MKSILAIAGLTLRAAVRYRFFIVMAVSLLLIVSLLPILIKHDGTAEGLLQILITYTLSAVFVLLGASTLWMSCGVLSRDIDDCSIQMLVVKPVPRWKIWLGKWVGIFFINFTMLTVCGTILFGLISWRAGKLTEEQKAVLHNELLVGRGVAAREIEDNDKLVEEVYKERAKNNEDFAALPKETAMEEVRKYVEAYEQMVPAYSAKVYQVNMSSMADDVKDKALQLQLKFNPSRKDLNNRYPIGLVVGNSASTNSSRLEIVLPGERATIVPLPANLLDESGRVAVQIQNLSEFDLSFPPDEGIQILFHQYGFRLNFLRGLAILLFWLSLLSAIGLSAGTFLSFPVASFLSLSLLVIGMSTGLISEVLDDGTLLPASFQGPMFVRMVVDLFFLPMFQVIVGLFSAVLGFSPIDSLSSGRSITWGDLFRALFQIVIVMGGAIAALGMYIFTRRELATAQNQE